MVHYWYSTPVEHITVYCDMQESRIFAVMRESYRSWNSLDKSIGIKTTAKMAELVKIKCKLPS